MAQHEREGRVVSLGLTTLEHGVPDSLRGYDGGPTHVVRFTTGAVVGVRVRLFYTAPFLAE